jgi:hypothetical protein
MSERNSRIRGEEPEAGPQAEAEPSGRSPVIQAPCASTREIGIGQEFMRKLRTKFTGRQSVTAPRAGLLTPFRQVILRGETKLKPHE